MPQVVCDGNGFVRGFPYHDGRLDGVLVSDCGTEVCLALRDRADGRRVLTLRHVSALHVDGFRQGNIVLNLRTVPADQVGCDEELSRIVRERLFIKPETLPQDATLFLLESSFGAEVVAIYRDLEINEGRWVLSTWA